MVSSKVQPIKHLCINHVAHLQKHLTVLEQGFLSGNQERVPMMREEGADARDYGSEGLKQQTHRDLRAWEWEKIILLSWTEPWPWPGLRAERAASYSSTFAGGNTQLTLAQSRKGTSSSPFPAGEMQGHEWQLQQKLCSGIRTTAWQQRPQRKTFPQTPAGAMGIQIR